MAYRFKASNVFVTNSGATSNIAHGLPATPTEYWVAAKSLGVSAFYFSATAVDATNINLIAGATNVSADVFAAVVHSIIA